MGFVRRTRAREKRAEGIGTVDPPLGDDVIVGGMVEHPDDRALLERALLAPLNAEGNNLRQLLEQVSGHWGYEGPVYRFYHQSLKVFALESTTTAIVSRPAALLPERSLNPVDHRSGYHRSRDLFAEFLGLLHTVRCPPYVRDELPRLAS